MSTNDPDNKRVIKKVLYPELAKCGESVNGHEYFYEQNVAPPRSSRRPAPPS